MINQRTKDKIETLRIQYQNLANNSDALRLLALSEIAESVYNSNAIENSTLSLDDTEKIINQDTIPRELDTREVYEALNLAKITEEIIDNSQKELSIQLILDMHKMLLTNIRDDWAGKFRHGKQWVRVGNHIGANPDFVSGLMSELVEKYNNSNEYFLDKIAYFHAEFEYIHPFPDGNGRIGRALINQQLLYLGYPPIIVRAKSKTKEYYPLFRKYQTNFDYSGFINKFAILLLESLHKRISILGGERIIKLSTWAKSQQIKGNAATNKAIRQTIPAFRVGNTWMIGESYRENL